MTRAPEGIGFTTAERATLPDEQRIEPDKIKPGDLVVTRFGTGGRQIGLVKAINRTAGGTVKSLRCFRFRQASKAWTETAVRVEIADVFGLYDGHTNVVCRLVGALTEGTDAWRCWRDSHPVPLTEADHA